MVLKQNKRPLENGQSHQPAKCHKHLDYNLCQATAVVESVPSRISEKLCFPLYMHKFGGDESCSSSRVSDHGKCDAFNDDAYSPEQDGDGKLGGGENAEKDAAAEDRLPASVTTHNGITDRCWRRLGFPATTGTELLDSQNSDKEIFHSQCSMPIEEVAEAGLTSETLGASVLFEDGCQTLKERVWNGQHAKNMETCTSVSSVGNSRRSRFSKDLEFKLVPAPSPSSENMLCNSEALDGASKGLVNLEEQLLTVSPPCECEGFSFPAYSEADCSVDPHFAHGESSSDIDNYKRVPIGPEFQAEIPPWRPQALTSSPVACEKKSTHAIHVNDDKSYSHGLVGTRVWPPLGSNGGVDKDMIGQGRSTNCSCPDQSSIRCVKEHIDREREKLKLKLGEAFYLWGFDDMGESVSKKWTRKEEQTFWELVNMNPISSNKNFWDYLSVAFPSRSKKELVSYYFNVFVLQRRALQNRLDPDNIDSDDDEADWQDCEIEASCRHFTTEDDDESVAESDATEGDDEVAESDATGDEMVDATEDDDEEAASYMSEEYTAERDIHKIRFGDVENEGMDCQEYDNTYVTGEFVSHFPKRLDHTNKCRDLVEGQDLKDDSCMSYEWSRETKSSGMICISAAGFHALQEENVKEATNFDIPHKVEKQLDLRYENDMSCQDVKGNGFLSCKEEFVMDGHCSILEPTDSKLWDIALVRSFQTDVDRLVSTCSMIKELFGEEARENEKIRKSSL